MRFFGAIFFVIGIGFLAWDAVDWLIQQRFQLAPLGQRWFELHSDSLGLAQAGIQRRVSAGLWETAIQPVLTWPAAAIFIGLGLLLLLIAAWRRR